MLGPIFSYKNMSDALHIRFHEISIFLALSLSLSVYNS